MPKRASALDSLAAQELQLAYEWYERQSARAAQRFQRAVERTVDRIEANAELGTAFQRRYRWMRVRRFPYVLYYEIRDPGPVRIWAVAHTGRRPGYWIRRARP